MLSPGQIKKLGFVLVPADVGKFIQVWLFDMDETCLVLTNELGSGMYVLTDGRRGVLHEYWRGALTKPITLVRKLIVYGNNRLKRIQRSK